MPRLEDITRQVGSNTACSILFDTFQNACAGVSYVWCCGITLWNKLMHSINGNMGKSLKGKGKSPNKGQDKGKGKGVGPDHAIDTQFPRPIVDVSSEITQAIQAAIPDAARIRMQSTLLPQEWSVPVHVYQTLGSQGGVAVVPKEHIAEVIRRVGFTSHPVAIIITQDPDSLGLRGYVRHRIRCGLSVMGPEGTRLETQVERFLVQLGFGEHVIQTMYGKELSLMTTMSKMTVKLPERHGWPSGPHPASVIVDQLLKYVPEPSFSDIVPRDGPSATFLLHVDFVDTLLKNSGKNGVFFKTNDGSEMELLWLDSSCDLGTAVKKAMHDSCYGVIEKGSAMLPRFAIRFRSLPALQEFAQKFSIEDVSNYGRWKINGIPATIGLHGLAALLHELKWLQVQILYITEGHAVFLSGSRGWDEPA
eukprot:s235_g12.t1